MEILYFTTAIAQSTFETIVQTSRKKPSAAPQTFETALINGLSGYNDIHLTLYSFPMISMFPGSNMLLWNKKEEQINFKYNTSWIPTINLPFLKQFFWGQNTKNIIKKWVKKYSNIDDKVILIYSIYAPIAKYIIRLSKKYKVKCFVIVGDLPRDMYNNRKINPLFRFFSFYNVREAIKIQEKFDGYILLTQNMAKEICKNKSYLVIEGIYEPINMESETIRKATPPALLYAGALNKKYGLDVLLEVFSELPENVELWLCGSGDMEEEILNYSQKYKNIIFWGRLPRAEVLRKEIQATLLINLRNSLDEYTKFSFPSKTMEYMASGTPFLTTKLPGIPDEYFSYIYSIESMEKEFLKEKILNLLLKPDFTIASRAKLFILEEKNSHIQAGKIINFLKKNIYVNI